MSIRTKILIPLLAFLLLGAGVSGLIGAKSLSGFARLASMSGEAITASDASRTARDGFDEAERLLERVLAMTDMVETSSIEPRFRATTTTTAAALGQLKTAALTPGMSGIAQDAIDHFTHWQKDAEVLLGLQPAKEIATLEVMRRSGDNVRALLDKAVALAGQDARTGIADETTALEAEMRLIFLIALAVALGGAVGAFLLASNLSQPLRELVRSAERLAGGDVSVRIGALDRKDEVGEIARAVDVFRANVTAQAEAETGATEQRRIIAEERQANDAVQTRASREQQTVTDAIAVALQRLARGDLTGELSGFPTTYGVLEADYNAAIAQLRDTIVDVTRDTRTISSGTREVSIAADDLSGRTEQQAASLEETAVALDRITKTVRETANGAQHAHQAVSHAKAEAEKTGSVVRDAVAAMAELERSSGQISQIVGVIDSIAFQTNLLALNAGVEAARAGDAGRGFAVVASEVRALAQRSADSAREIKQLISQSSLQIGSGVSLVRQTGSALDRILAQVGEINGIITMIAKAAGEQAAGLDQVNTAVADMGNVTQQNAQLVEQSATAGRDLAAEAEKLAALVARFTVSGPSAKGGAGVRHPGRPAATGRGQARAA